MSIHEIINNINISERIEDAIRSDIISTITNSYENSETAKNMFDKIIQNEKHIFIYNMKDEFGVFNEYYDSIEENNSGESYIFIDPDKLNDTAYLSKNGTGVKTTFEFALLHEFVHAIEGVLDPPNDSIKDKNPDDDLIFSDNINPDKTEGPTVKIANQIYSELGLIEQRSYQGHSETGDITPGREYTNGTPIDLALYGDSWNTTNHTNHTSNALLIGSNKMSILTSGAGDDFLYGQGGDDILKSGREGADHVEGGPGDDVIYGDEHDIFISGDEGNDTYIYFGNGDANFDLKSGSFENAGGGEGNDTFIGTDEANIIQGMEGNDVLRGEAGDDTIIGGYGDDHVYGGDGNDEIYGDDHEHDPIGMKLQSMLLTQAPNSFAFSDDIFNINSLVPPIPNPEFHEDIDQQSLIISKHNEDYARQRDINSSLKDSQPIIFPQPNNDGSSDNNSYPSLSISNSNNAFLLRDNLEIDIPKFVSTIFNNNNPVLLNIENNLDTPPPFVTENGSRIFIADDILIDEEDLDAYKAKIDSVPMIFEEESAPISSSEDNFDNIEQVDITDEVIFDDEEEYIDINEDNWSFFLFTDEQDDDLEDSSDNQEKHIKISFSENDSYEIIPHEDENIQSSSPSDGLGDIEGSLFLGDLFEEEIYNINDIAIEGADVLKGEKGDDTLKGGGGDDILDGGDDDDYLDGGAGDDQLLGGNGDDTLLFGPGIDVYDGGAGNDTVDFRDYVAEEISDPIGGNAPQLQTIIFDLTYETISLNEYCSERMTGIENILAGSTNDIIMGNEDNNILDGGPGQDHIYGYTGDDIMTGGLGMDIFRFERGNGRDVITDFQPGYMIGHFYIQGDKIQIHMGSYNLSNLSNHIRQDGDDVVIDFNNDDQLTLENLDAAHLHMNDFMFL